MKTIISTILIITISLGGIGCSSMSNQEKGAVIGAGAGAAAGAAIGNAAGNTAMGAILGAFVGGAAGVYIGNYMDKQAAEMERDLEGATITRVGEGIKVTFDSGLLFDSSSAAVKAPARTNLENLAAILQKYPDTDVLIEGHTDATGSDEFNLTLSQQRAQAVANHLASLQVDSSRFTIMGYGEAQPIADNALVEGRTQNRRVELAIMANDKLKQVAEKQAG